MADAKMAAARLGSYGSAGRGGGRCPATPRPKLSGARPGRSRMGDPRPRTAPPAAPSGDGAGRAGWTAELPEGKLHKEQTKPAPLSLPRAAASPHPAPAPSTGEPVVAPRWAPGPEGTA